MEVSKKEAAKILGVSPKEVMRRIESGELKGRRKTDSKFSDWLITVPEGGQWVEKEIVEKEIETKKLKNEEHPSETQVEKPVVKTEKSVVKIEEPVVKAEESVVKKEEENGTGRETWWF